MRPSIICILVAFTVCSCTPTFYIPNTQNVPLLSAKSQTNIVASLGNEMFDLNLAHAAGENFGVMLNTTLAPNRIDENGNGGKGAFVELGGGYFKPISDNFLFEVYGLAGFGALKNVNRSSISGNPGTSGVFESNIARLGVQPAIAFTSKYFTAAVSGRLASLNYMNPKGSLVHNGVEQVKHISDKSSYMIFEPALTLRAGLHKVKVQLQVQGSFNLTDKDFPQENSMSSLGLVFSL